MVVKKPGRKLIFVTLLSDVTAKGTDDARTFGKQSISYYKKWDLMTGSCGVTNTKVKAALLLFDMSRKKMIEILKNTP